MWIFTERLQSNSDNVVIETTLTLPYHLRQKSRLKVTLDNGVEAGLMLTRGETLRGGQLLRSEDGQHIIKICAAHEPVSTATTHDAQLMARACYHLGNRHVPLQIDNNRCRYLVDHVLDDMVKSLGLTVKNESAPFEPEDGAYSAHGHSHASVGSEFGGAHAHSHSHGGSSHSHASSHSSSGHSHSSSSSSSSRSHSHHDDQD